MQTFQSNLTMAVNPEHVFDYVSEPRNWPRFLPTVKSADLVRGEHERVQMKGESHGRPYNTEGYLKVDRHRFNMQWGMEGEHGYQGSLEVRQTESTEIESEISLELRFVQPPGGGRDVTREMDHTLANIRDHFLLPYRR